MKKAVLKFLFSRQVGKLQDTLSKAVRNSVTALGGVLVGQGLATPENIDTLQGAAVVVVGILLSFARTFVADRLKD